MDDKDVQKRLAVYLEVSERIKEEGHLDSEEHQKDLETKKRLFQQVISEMGMSSEEQEELEKMGNNFLDIAQDFYSKDDLEQSGVFAEKAAQLLPYDLGPLELLLRVYVGFPDEESQNKAKEIASDILKLDSSHKTALVIKHQEREKSSANIWVFLMIGFLVVTSLLGVATYFVLASDDSTELSTSTKSIDLVPFSPEVKIAEENVVSKVNTTITGEAEDRLPIAFVDSLEGIQFEDRGSEFNFYDGSYSYKLKVILKNQGTDELGEIVAVIELVDGSGGSVTQKKMTLHEEYEPVIRPQETVSLDHLIYEEIIDAKNYKHPEKVRVKFTKMKHTPAPKLISKEKVEIIWAGGKPEQFTLDIERRQHADNYGSENSFMKTYRTKNIYEVTNTGSGVIRSLKLQEEILDSKGNILFISDSLLTYSSTAYIGAGETRTSIFFGKIKEKASKIRVTVLEIE